MKVTVTNAVLGFDGMPIKTGDNKDLTFREVIATAVNQMDDNITTEQKMKGYEIGIRVYKKAEINFSVDDASFIKERVGKIYSPVVFGRVSELFDPPTKESEDSEDV